jgi:hypothetical protein
LITAAAIVGLLAGCTVAAALAAGGSSPPGSSGDSPKSRGIAVNRRAANVEARRLLADVALPSGARPLKHEPRGRHSSLGAPWEGAIFAAEVDRHGFWKTSASPSAVVASFESHPPAGAKLGQAASSGGFAAATFEMGTSRRFVFGPEQLMVSAVVLPDGLTGVRADAVVRYLAPRTRAERVPAAARLVQITKANFGEKPFWSRVVRRRSLVLAVARIVDSLPFEGHGTGAYSCPADNGVATVTFVFRATSDGPALAEVSELANTPVWPFPCDTTAVTIHGKQLPPLLDGGILLKRASKLLGLKLTD